MRSEHRRLFELPFRYEDLGYRALALLNKTDSKWLWERFREPRQHTTLNAMHADVWQEYEDKLLTRRKNDWG